jgi:hypothetical protein
MPPLTKFPVSNNLQWAGDEPDFAGKSETIRLVQNMAMEGGIADLTGGFLSAMFDALMGALPVEGLLKKLAMALATKLGDALLTGQAGFDNFVQGVAGEILKALADKAPPGAKEALGKLADKVAEKAGEKSKELTEEDKSRVNDYLKSQCAIKLIPIKGPYRLLASKKVSSITGLAIVDTVDGTAHIMLYLPPNGSIPAVGLETRVGSLPEEGKPWNYDTVLQFHRMPL